MEPGKSFSVVLENELDLVGKSREARAPQTPIPERGSAPSEGPKALATALLRADRGRLAGLALSGGGIRSAIFNLGVIQALAELGLIRCFDYLSTVSGGGFIGGWLTAWLRRKAEAGAQVGRGERQRAQGALEEVVEALSPIKRRGDDRAEAEEIGLLRQYSNYLTPTIGLFSVDTWTFFGAYLRNLLVNLLVLAPALTMVLLTPRLIVLALKWRLPFQYDVNLTAWVFASLMLLLAFSMIGFNLGRPPNPGSAGDKNRTNPQFFYRQDDIFFMAVIPCLLAAGALAWRLLHLDSGLGGDGNWLYWGGAGAGAYALLWIVALIAGRCSLCASVPQLLGVLFTALPSGFLGGLGLGLVREFLVKTGNDLSAWYLVSCGIPSVILIFLGVVVLHLGLSSHEMPEHTREWWNRLGGLLLVVTFGWVALAALALHSAAFLEWLAEHHIAASVLGSGWLASALTVLLPQGGRRKVSSLYGIGLSIALPLFVVGLIAVWSWGTEGVTRQVATALAPEGTSLAVSVDDSIPEGSLLSLITKHLLWANQTRTAALWVFLASAASLALLSWRVDLNKFSLHYLYRNRLIRCFLGASNRKRAGHPFTGFDPGDDLDLAVGRVAQEGPPETWPGPYPLIAASLSLTAGKRLAWQRRQAASFVFSPLFCGFDSGLVSSANGNAVQGAYRETRYYDRERLSLGSALAISGAAVSPGMGQYSSAPLNFLLTFFNLRLGAWLQNPAYTEFSPDSWSPAISSTVKELLGRMDIESKQVYVTDGGHFENLGIYELVKRRCRLIVACDADSDPEFALSDLSEAVEKCRTDLGTEIELNTDSLRPDEETGLSERHFVVGTIRYRPVDGVQAQKGVLLYLKSSLSGDEPADVLGYKADHESFPHQSTADQWFDERQFESYRRLGYHATIAAFKPVVKRLDSQSYFNLPESGPLPERGNRSLEDAAPTVADLAFGLQRAWYPRPPQLGQFARHGEALDRIFDRLRSDKQLQFLDRQVYPEWDTFNSTPEAARRLLPDSQDELRAGFYLCSSMIQLMENVYHDLDLNQQGDHPDNRGWMNLFRHWRGSAMFRATWAMTISTYGAHFQSFCEQRLGLSGLRQLETTSLSMDARSETLNFVERELIGQFERINRQTTEVWGLRLRIDADPARSGTAACGQGPCQGPPLTLQVGFALLSGNRLVYFRIQDHLRHTGLARLGLVELLKHHPQLENEIDGFAPPEAEIPSACNRNWFNLMFAEVTAGRRQGKQSLMPASDAIA